MLDSYRSVDDLVLNQLSHRPVDQVQEVVIALEVRDIGPVRFMHTGAVNRRGYPDVKLGICPVI
jgi:hypothetical protein